jgi:hypothetical protein
LIGNGGLTQPLLTVSPSVKARVPGKDQGKKKQAPEKTAKRRLMKDHQEILTNYKKKAHHPEGKLSPEN